MIMEDLEKAELVGMLNALSHHMTYVANKLRQQRPDKCSEMLVASKLCIEWANRLDDEIFDRQ